MTPVKEDLIYFLKHGEMKNFPLGIHRQKMFELLGEPEADLLGDLADILYYGNFEFYFIEPGNSEWLCSIKKSSYRGEYHCETIDFEPYRWSSELTIKRSVRVHGKSWYYFSRNDASLWWLTKAATDSGAVTVFGRNDEESDDPYCLISFYSRTLNKYPDSN